MSSAARCLENSLIVQKVFKSCNLLANLQLRLVSKTFNQECLRQIRFSHRKIVLDISETRFAVNSCHFNIRQHPECFLFLTKTAGVRLEELEISTKKVLSGEMKTLLHRNILSVLIKDQDQLRVLFGMSEVCKVGCYHCTYYATKCREYGPVVVDVFDKHAPVHHYDKLTVTEHLFWQIAAYCTKLTKSCSVMITPKISCDYLKVVINDNLLCFFDSHFGKFERVIPREVIEEMCRTWKVKFVEIEMKRVPKKHWSSYWTLAKTFTEFEFEGRNENNKVSKGFKLESVELNLLNSQSASRTIFHSHLMDNIRNLFPSHNYRILNHKSPWGEMTSNQFEAILKSVFTGYSPDSAITLRCNHRIDGLLFEMPSEISIDGRVFTCSVSSAIIQSADNIAKSFVITDKATGNVLNLEIYVDKKQLDELKFKGGKLGFLKYYL